jgi:hypothetical protein
MKHNMVKYQWYRIRHRGVLERYDRKSEMQYLGVHELSRETGRIVHLFNARPTAGTQSVFDEEIISVQELPRTPRVPLVSVRWT